MAPLTRGNQTLYHIATVLGGTGSLAKQRLPRQRVPGLKAWPRSTTLAIWHCFAKVCQPPPKSVHTPPSCAGPKYFKGPRPGPPDPAQIPYGGESLEYEYSPTSPTYALATPPPSPPPRHCGPGTGRPGHNVEPATGEKRKRWSTPTRYPNEGLLHSVFGSESDEDSDIYEFARRKGVC